MSIQDSIANSESRQEDFRVIREAVSGSQDAYKFLMKKYHDPIYNLIFKMIHDKSDVEDLTQEAFIKAFNSLPSFNFEFAFSTWLYKIATNNSIDYLRKKKIKTFSINKPIETKDGEVEYEIPDSTFVPDQPVIFNQKRNIIQDAIDTLPEKYQTVIIMRHQEEKSYEEISEELNLPLGTVKAHLFRAREILYKQLRSKIKNY